MELKLIPAQESFIDSFMEWRRDAETIKYNPLAPPDLESIKKRLKNAGSDLAKFDQFDNYLWFVEVEGALSGQINLSLNRIMLTAEIGYTVAPKSRSKGVATGAIRIVANKVFSETPIRKLIAYVHDKNLHSRNALEKVGFKMEGLLREHYLINGKPADEAIYGLLRTDFTV